MSGSESPVSESRSSGYGPTIRRLALLAAVFVAPCGGCGYSIRAPFDKNVKTVFVPIFKTQSFRRDLNLNLTEMIQKEIMYRTPYKVVGSPDGADTVLEGSINFANKNIVVENPWNLPRELNASITAKVKWTHNPPSEEEQKQPPTIISETVNFVPEVGETSMTAYYRVNQRLAAQIVDMMEKPWYTERDAQVTTAANASRDATDITLWQARGRAIVTASDPIPKVMGIVNITPDSFSDGGDAFTPERALEHARSLVADGANLLDLGGESTRPGSLSVSLDEELFRVLPALEQCAAELAVPLSIDTSKAKVAELALARGASIINDVTALRGDPDMARVAAEAEAGVVLMHMLGEPATMQRDPFYHDVVAEVLAFLAERIAWCEARGIPRCRIAVDPGIGFGKTIEHNLLLLRNLKQSANLGCAVLIGTSRKGLLGTLTGREVSERTVASVVSSLAACAEGARIVRVHDVAAMVDAIKVWTAIRGWGEVR